jgi:hypothetical protein
MWNVPFHTTVKQQIEAYEKVFLGIHEGGAAVSISKKTTI